LKPSLLELIGKNMKEIPLSRGLFALVDDEWFDYLNGWKWYATPIGRHSKTPYATRKEGPYSPHIYMHNVIACISPGTTGMQADHKDGNGLNNQSKNLRVCTEPQNKMNKGKYKNNTSGYKGVSWNKNLRKWSVKLQVNKKQINLGYFTDKIEAAKAYNQAALRHHGEFARLNIIT
jgi:hypothetical protein